MKEKRVIRRVQKLRETIVKLRQSYVFISPIIMFPTDKNLIEEVFQFENHLFLEILNCSKDYHFLIVIFKLSDWLFELFKCLWESGVSKGGGLDISLWGDLDEVYDIKRVRVQIY